jgi:hypothetical protein
MTIFLYLDSLNSVIQNAVEALALFEKQIDAGLTNSFSKKLQVDWQESVFGRILRHRSFAGDFILIVSV